MKFRKNNSDELVTVGVVEVEFGVVEDAQVAVGCHGRGRGPQWVLVVEGVVVAFGKPQLNVLLSELPQ